MTDQPTQQPPRAGGFLARASLPVLALVGLVIMGGVGAGGFYAYRTYDYVQHDNDFCMSCHLMAEPYELFARSAHRGLGCKACHQPTLLARSQMALTQIVENPGEISVHAEVPNRRCTNCHIDGDPERWRIIANTAGHKAHLESDDPVLRGVQCVECHSTSVHEFAPIDRTCAQSGCHEDNQLSLGGMSDLTIHCSACHTFVAPVAPDSLVLGAQRTGVDAAVLPDREECLSCHVMRTLVQLPDPDPHKGSCGACHNPHTQTEPVEAAESCARSGCHTDVGDLSPFHRGMQPGVVEGCLNCHAAHDFSVDGVRCVDCHQGILDDRFEVTPLPQPRREVIGQAPVAEQPTGTGVLGAGMGWWSHAAQEQVQERPQEILQFRHSQHRTVECGNCHESSERHGGLTVRTLADCRACHHQEPVSRNCARCHDDSDVPHRTFQAVRPVSFSVGTRDPARSMAFPHATHEGLNCSTCHTRGLTLSATAVDCASCHQEHHDPDNECASCHVPAPVSAHPPSEAHVTCSGAACHQNVPFASVPRTRSTCLGCHQDMRDHRPGRRCAECHTLPAPRSDG